MGRSEEYDDDVNDGLSEPQYSTTADRGDAIPPEIAAIILVLKRSSRILEAAALRTRRA
jgi:hypothetical protein